MRQDGKTNKQTATNLAIDKLSVVANPAHTPALAAIIKSAVTDDGEENVIKQTFMEALSEINLEEQTDQLMNGVWDTMWALRKSIRKTMGDENITNKKEVIQNNISDFATSLGSLISTTNVIKTGGKDMTPEEIKAMIKEAVDPIQKDLGTAQAIVKMDAKTRVHYDALDAEGQENFLKMTPEDQASIIEKKEADLKKSANDETFELHGQIIRKSVVGESVFIVLKAQQEEIDKGKSDLIKERETREIMEFTKQAEGMYPNLPGEAQNKGLVMKAIAGMSSAVRDTLSGMLKAGNTGIELSKSFEDLGSDSIPTEGSSPVAKLNKMAEDKAAEDKISFAKAYDEVLKTDEGADLYAKSLKK